jgi:hypothetical protein
MKLLQNRTLKALHTSVILFIDILFYQWTSEFVSGASGINKEVQFCSHAEYIRNNMGV